MPTLLHSSQWMAVNQADEKTVEIDITGLIGGSFWDLFDPNSDESKNTREKMRAELKAISEIKANKIIVNIDSLGGDVGHGLSIHDMLVEHSAEVETRITGLSASIATVISQAGNKRTISDNALMLIHRASYGIMGSFNQIELNTAISDLNKFDDRIINIYEKRSKKKREEFESMMNENMGNGKWIDGTEAQDLGLVDEIFEPQRRAAASYDKGIFNKLKYPEIPKNMTEDNVKTFGEKLDSLAETVKAFFSPKPEEKPEDKIIVKSDLEIANEKITAFENQIAELKAANEAEKAGLEELKKTLTAKQAEAENLVTELKALKNEWVPESRSKGTASAELTGLDKDAVREVRNKSKSKK